MQHEFESPKTVHSICFSTYASLLKFCSIQEENNREVGRMGVLPILPTPILEPLPFHIRAIKNSNFLQVGFFAHGEAIDRVRRIDKIGYRRIVPFLRIIRFNIQLA